VTLSGPCELEGVAVGMAGRLRGKRCLIVGGTGGLGLAAAARFLDEGASLVVAGLPDISPEQSLTALRQTCEPESHVHVITADVTASDEVEHLFGQTLAILGGLDVLFHVAGRSGRRDGDGPLHDCDDHGWQTTLDANLGGTFRTNRAAVRHFLSQGQPGAILNMSSILALAPSPLHFDTCAYAAAKGGVISLSRLAAARYAADGIRVNVLAPGLMDTPMAARALQNEAVMRFLTTKQPLTGGPGRPGAVAEAAVYLCSDEARFLTGVVLPVDGGWSVSEGQYVAGGAASGA
jgi:NAD(P)-dependent dehydrogenase (short-subunit alcohol dehydrogenase family)